MGVIDAVTLIVAIALAILGFSVGFGKVLRFFTKGVFGVILSVFLCATFGGMIQGIEIVGEWLEDLNAWLGSAWSFLETIHLATVIYYVLLFCVIQVLRILIVKFIVAIFESELLVVRILNKILGAVLLVAVVFLLTLLVLACIQLFGGDLSSSLDGTFLGILYENNPVKFSMGSGSGI